MRVTVATTELGTLACLYCCVLSLVPLASVAWILAAGTLVVLWVTAAWRQVRANGLLSYASPELRGNRDVVLASVARNSVLWPRVEELSFL